jgi:2-polyprenyl-3-methyl-5-hydroxy-6-metoxy-1,4-benzoquinol methylase
VAEWHQQRALPILTHLNPYRKIGTLLEVGCAAGFFLKVAQQEGWQTYGAEIMAPAVEYALTRLGLNVFEGTLEQAQWSDAFFDVIVLIETIEHLLDPFAVLCETYRVLRPGGAVWVATPNLNSAMRSLLGGDWSILSPAEHLFYFTEQTLAQMLRQAGFRAVEFVWQLEGHTLLETMNPHNTHRPTSRRSRLVKWGTEIFGPRLQPWVIKSKRTDRLSVLAVK